MQTAFFLNPIAEKLLLLDQYNINQIQNTEPIWSHKELNKRIQLSTFQYCSCSQ